MKRHEFIRSNFIIISSSIFLPKSLLNFNFIEDPIEINLVKDQVAASVPSYLYNQRTKNKIASTEGLISLYNYLEEHKNDRNAERVLNSARDMVYNNYELDKSSWGELSKLFQVEPNDIYIMGQGEQDIAQGIIFGTSAFSTIVAPETAFTLTLTSGLFNQSVEKKWPFNDISSGIKTDIDYDNVFDTAEKIIVNKIITTDGYTTQTLLDNKEFRAFIGLPPDRSNNEIITITPPTLRKSVSNFLANIEKKKKDESITKKDLDEAFKSLKSDIIAALKIEFEKLHSKEAFLNELDAKLTRAENIEFQKQLNYKVQEVNGAIIVFTSLIGIDDPQTAAKFRIVLTSALSIISAEQMLAHGLIGPLSFAGVIVSSLFAIFSPDSQVLAEQIADLKNTLLEVQRNLQKLIIDIYNRIEKRLDSIYQLDLEIYNLLREFAQKSLQNEQLIYNEVVALNQKIQTRISNEIQDSRKNSLSDFITLVESLDADLRINNEQYEKALIKIANKCQDAYLSYFNGNLENTKDINNWIEINKRLIDFGELTYSFGLIEQLGASLSVYTGKLPNPYLWFNRCFCYLEARILNIDYQSKTLTKKTQELYLETLRIQKSIYDITRKEKSKTLMDEREKVLELKDSKFDEKSKFIEAIKSSVQNAFDNLIFSTSKVNEIQPENSMKRGVYIIDNAISGESKIYQLEEGFDFFKKLEEQNLIRRYLLQDVTTYQGGTSKRFRVCLNDDKYSRLYYPSSFNDDSKLDKLSGCIGTYNELVFTQQSSPVSFGIHRQINNIKYDLTITFEAGSVVYYFDQDWKEAGFIQTILNDIRASNIKNLKENLTKSAIEKLKSDAEFSKKLNDLTSNSIKIRMFFSLLNLKETTFYEFINYKTRVQDFPLPISDFDSLSNLFQKSSAELFDELTDKTKLDEIPGIFVSKLSDDILHEFKLINENFENVYNDTISDTSIQIIDRLTDIFRSYIYVNKGYI